MVVAVSTWVKIYQDFILGEIEKNGEVVFLLNFLLLSSSKILTSRFLRPRQDLWNICPSCDAKSISLRPCQISLHYNGYLYHIVMHTPVQNQRGTLERRENLQADLSGTKIWSKKMNAALDRNSRQKRVR